MNDKSVTIAVTGASGSLYFIQLVYQLLHAQIKVNLLLSTAAKEVLKIELNVILPKNESELKLFLINYFVTMLSINKIDKRSTVTMVSKLLFIYSKEEWTSPVASGSNPANAMVVCPCSMGTLSSIAHGASNNLIERAADVMLKERKPLILLTREMPFSSIHLENMLKLSNIGVTIMPASPGFYHQPKNMMDLVHFVIARILDHLDIRHHLMSKWGH
jgi:4-hydroxy-3-polyprenylbenzoate decarboxylase